jgi:hypothetical protein
MRFYKKAGASKNAGISECRLSELRISTAWKIGTGKFKRVQT